MADAENIIVVAGYCQEEILSWTYGYLHALCVSTCIFIWGFVQNQSVVNLLSHAGFLAKNQMPDQALQWIRIPGIVHLNPDEPERVLCWKSDVKTSPSVQVWLRMWPVDTVPFRMRQILPGRPCRGGQGYYRPMEIPGTRLNVKTVFPRYGDSHVKDKMVMSCKDPLFA